MNVNITTGGIIEISHKSYQLQFYYPFFQISNFDGHSFRYYFDALTSFNIHYVKNQYVGGGIMVFGFGIGFCNRLNKKSYETS